MKHTVCNNDNETWYAIINYTYALLCAINKSDVCVYPKAIILNCWWQELALRLASTKAGHWLFTYFKLFILWKVPFLHFFIQWIRPGVGYFILTGLAQRWIICIMRMALRQLFKQKQQNRKPQMASSDFHQPPQWMPNQANYKAHRKAHRQNLWGQDVVMSLPNLRMLLGVQLYFSVFSGCERWLQFFLSRLKFLITYPQLS